MWLKVVVVKKTHRGSRGSRDGGFRLIRQTPSKRAFGLVGILVQDIARGYQPLISPGLVQLPRNDDPIASLHQSDPAEEPVQTDEGPRDRISNARASFQRVTRRTREGI